MHLCKEKNLIECIVYLSFSNGRPLYSQKQHIVSHAKGFYIQTPQPFKQHNVNHSGKKSPPSSRLRASPKKRQFVGHVPRFPVVEELPTNEFLHLQFTNKNSYMYRLASEFLQTIGIVSTFGGPSLPHITDLDSIITIKRKIDKYFENLIYFLQQKKTFRRHRGQRPSPNTNTRAQPAVTTSTTFTTTTTTSTFSATTLPSRAPSQAVPSQMMDLDESHNLASSSSSLPTLSPQKRRGSSSSDDDLGFLAEVAERDRPFLAQTLMSSGGLPSPGTNATPPAAADAVSSAVSAMGSVITSGEILYAFCLLLPFAYPLDFHARLNVSKRYIKVKTNLIDLCSCHFIQKRSSRPMFLVIPHPILGGIQ